MADDETTPPPDETTPDAAADAESAVEAEVVEAAEAEATGEAEAAPETPVVAAEAEAAAEAEGEAAAVEAVAEESGEPVVEADVLEVQAAPRIEAEGVVEEAAPPAETETAAPVETAADAEGAPRAKPAIPGADLEVDIVPEGADPLARGEGGEEGDAEAGEPSGEPGSEESAEEPAVVTQATIDLAAGARYRATGKRKTAIARVILKPGNGAYTINGKPLHDYFPRPTLQRTIRQPLETVGYEDRMDVTASLVGGGVSAQAGALRHGISRALLDADPNLRGELKRRGFLTRDARAKERRKAGLKKARKRPQFSKR